MLLDIVIVLNVDENGLGFLKLYLNNEDHTTSVSNPNLPWTSTDSGFWAPTPSTHVDACGISSGPSNFTGSADRASGLRIYRELEYNSPHDLCFQFVARDPSFQPELILKTGSSTTGISLVYTGTNTLLLSVCTLGSTVTVEIPLNRLQYGPDADYLDVVVAIIPNKKAYLMVNDQVAYATVSSVWESNDSGTFMQAFSDTACGLTSSITPLHVKQRPFSSFDVYLFKSWTPSPLLPIHICNNGVLTLDGEEPICLCQAGFKGEVCDEVDASAPLPASCHDIDHTVSSGAHWLRPDPTADPVHLYCDMDEWMGGWTLCGKYDGDAATASNWALPTGWGRSRNNFNMSYLADLTTFPAGALTVAHGLRLLDGQSCRPYAIDTYNESLANVGNTGVLGLCRSRWYNAMLMRTSSAPSMRIENELGAPNVTLRLPASQTAVSHSSVFQAHRNATIEFVVNFLREPHMNWQEVLFETGADAIGLALYMRADHYLILAQCTSGEDRAAPVRLQASDIASGDVVVTLTVMIASNQIVTSLYLNHALRARLDFPFAGTNWAGADYTSIFSPTSFMCVGDLEADRKGSGTVPSAARWLAPYGVRLYDALWTNYDRCLSLTCANGGTCVDGWSLAPTCVCTADWQVVGDADELNGHTAGGEMRLAGSDNLYHTHPLVDKNQANASKAATATDVYMEPDFDSIYTEPDMGPPSKTGHRGARQTGSQPDGPILDDEQYLLPVSSATYDEPAPAYEYAAPPRHARQNQYQLPARVRRTENEYLMPDPNGPAMYTQLQRDASQEQYAVPEDYA
ncbi:uncharacterized protein MONBRDRAFT_37116 [Monosiga brevicollis MX1]|uniref:EGF-like domain-containing protein n=1 Tax=Monosiga brevicollis TaxID=81824 RepID=A9UZP3_MONBE|nr:uncharacterized protein MONBRDRAFT_37116 [Monosiga brevicollis MX1]EDQ89403.1 predicted protein [Monosiga brevicollis MX1]|eukprot:XP_001745979.1 hypothetical protein [Monosiga brevicollis MX1]